MVLKKLHFNNNNVNSINLNGCDTSLTELRCDINLLVSLELQNHYKLDSLSCSKNSLQHLDISSFCDTTYLFLNTINNPNLNCIKVQDVNWAVNTLTASVDTWSIFDLDCNVNIIDEQKINSTRKLIKVVDILGRESEPTPNVPLFYRYSDGSVEKKLIIE